MIDNIIVLMFGIAIPVLLIAILIAVVAKFAQTNLFKSIDKFVSELFEQLSLIIIAYVLLFPLAYIVLIHHVFIEKRKDRKVIDFYLFFGVQTPLMMIYVGCALYIVRYFLESLN